MVGGSSSGYTAVATAYVTTFTVTIAVSAICLALAFAMYGMRTDQKLRRDLRYGGTPPLPSSRANAFDTWLHRSKQDCLAPGLAACAAWHAHQPGTLQGPALWRRPARSKPSCPTWVWLCASWPTLANSPRFSDTWTVPGKQACARMHTS